MLSALCLKGQRVGIWFPTYKDLSEIWLEIVRTYKDATTDKNEQLKQIRLIGGGLIDFWSMEDPDSGRGRKYHRALVDEAAKAKKFKKAWLETIRPTLTDYKGDAYFFSTPKGKANYFYSLEQDMRGKPNWAMFKYTSYDNPYLDPAEIDDAKNQLDEISFLQEYMAEDVDASDRPFLYAFHEIDHCLSRYTPNENLPLVVSFDFNKDPMTCLVGQSRDIRHLCIFDELKINNGSTPELCEVLMAKYPMWLGRIIITGDASGNSRSPLVRGGLNHYKIIKKSLSVKDYQMRVRGKNHSHINSRMLCNSVIQNADFSITENCKETILDCITANVDETGEIIKTKEQGRHFFDNVRYMIDAVFPDFISNPKKYKK